MLSDIICAAALPSLGGVHAKHLRLYWTARKLAFVSFGRQTLLVFVSRSFFW